MSSTDIAVSVESLSKRYGSTHALSDVSMQIRSQTIHGLVGRNGAGKSTLVGSLVGDVRPDSGRILVADAKRDGTGGESALVERSGSSLREHIAAVHQQMKLVPDLSVAENLQLGLQPSFVSWKAMRETAAATLEEWGLSVEVDRPAGLLRLDQQQILTVARALLSGARIVLLDEPTSRLSWRETEELFSHVRSLTGRGVTFLFVSHSLRDVKELCDDVSVLRDGRLVASGLADEFTESDLVERMTQVKVAVGFESSSKPRESVERAFGESVLTLDKVSVGSRARDVSFELRSGEWIGITGLVGSGAVAIANAVAGFEAYTGGSIDRAGQPLKPGRVDMAAANGIGFVPPDRHANGLVPTMSVGENITLAAMKTLSRGGVLRVGEALEVQRNSIEELDIKTQGPGAEITSLSGGNQQKVLIARSLADNPDIVVLVNPTVGVDIASKEIIYEQIRAIREQGVSGIICSEDELSDFESCDRVLVMSEGELIAELDESRTSRDILNAVEGYTTEETTEK